jgi:MoxR-like ATPase
MIVGIGDGTAASVVLRARAEVQFAQELAALELSDEGHRPPHWRLSPLAVRTYVLGGRLPDGTEITPKYIGHVRIIEVAIATLATDRALLLSGVPGTGKSWLSEHLAAAISGDSSLMVQGTAGTDETAIRYGWNYAELLRSGPSSEALVPGPIMRAMQTGTLARVEELTRMTAETQDALITILSEKTLPIPELNVEVQAVQGFNVIATANNRDRAVNELSSALTRRFNTVVLPLPETVDREVEIVERRVLALGRALELPAQPPALEEIRRVVTIFRELRNGVTEDGKTRVKPPSGVLSTADAISVVHSGMAMAAYYGDGILRADDLAAGLAGTVIRDPVQDRVAWLEYLQTVVMPREGWSDFYRASQELM